MIRNQIEAVVNQLTAPDGFSSPKFFYGTAIEINTQLGSIASSDCYVLLYAQKPSKKSFTLSNAISSQYNIMLAFMVPTQFDQFTGDNEAYVNLMDSLADQFLVKLANFREQPTASRYFKVHENDLAQSQPVYNKGATANSTGVTLSITLQTMNNTNIPLP